MGSLGLISLLLAVAIIAATCGYIGSAIARRNKRRARGYFILGFMCGSMAGTILRRTRRGTDHFATRALTLVASHRRVGRYLPLGGGPSLGASRARTVNALTQRIIMAMANSMARPPKLLSRHPAPVPDFAAGQTRIYTRAASYMADRGRRKTGRRCCVSSPSGSPRTTSLTRCSAKR